MKYIHKICDISETKYFKIRQLTMNLMHFFYFRQHRFHGWLRKWVYFIIYFFPLSISHNTRHSIFSNYHKYQYEKTALAKNSACNLSNELYGDDDFPNLNICIQIFILNETLIKQCAQKSSEPFVKLIYSKIHVQFSPKYLFNNKTFKYIHKTNL